MNQPFNILSRRSFLSHAGKLGLGAALASLTDVPLVVKRALAEGNIGLNGKKLLFIWLRGANDSLNSLIPVEDSAYNLTNRPNILIPKDTIDYSAITGTMDFAVSGNGLATFDYANAIRTGNGFAAVHPSLKFLAPVYNAGDLAMIHRVGYPKQSRSHFDSQNYWENGSPNNNLSKDGIFYRTLLESGLTTTSPLTGVTVQSALPLIMRGSAAAMTNLTDPTRYNLFGIPNSTSGNAKADSFLAVGNDSSFPSKKNRDFLQLQYENLENTLSIFAGINFTDKDPDAAGEPTSGDGNIFLDDESTDGDTPYYLFPTRNKKNGGSYLSGRNGDTDKYAVDTGAYGFFRNLKAASLILNGTSAIIAGTELGGWDTHNNQGSVTGSHSNLLRRLGWSMYALQKFFKIYGKNGTNPLPGAQCSWDDLVIVTLSEFGRTSIQNSSGGTDHAEAGMMMVAGGGVRGVGKDGATSAILGCHPNDSIPWVTGQTGSMFGVNSRYLKRAYDYRSVLGKLIRDHLGATQGQLDRIITGYADSSEKLQTGGTSGIDSTPIIGEPDLLV